MENENILRLDVRSLEEWNDGHIPNAKHVFLPDLRDPDNHPEKNKPVAVYCDSGYRASFAASWLQAQYSFKLGRGLWSPNKS